MVAIVSGMVLECQTKVGFDEKHQPTESLSVLLFQTGQKNNVEVKKIPPTIWAEIKSGQQLTVKCFINDWAFSGKSGMSVSFIELPIVEIPKK